MTLIKCPECGHEIDSKLKECNNCGYTFGVSVKKMLAICGTIAAGAVVVTELLVNLCDISILSAKPEYIKFTEEVYIVEEGDSVDVEFNILPSYANNNISLEIEDTSIAEFKDGKILGNKVGTTKIYWKKNPNFARQIYVGNEAIGVPTAIEDFYIETGDSKFTIYLKNNKYDRNLYANADVDLQILNENENVIYTDCFKLYDYFSEYSEGFPVTIKMENIEPQESSKGLLRIHVYNEFFDLGWKERTIYYIPIADEYETDED